MPSNTFYHLDSKKQERIIQAGFQEFSKHRYDEVSISDIIQAANIPRGSFYQYFEDKEDLFFYLAVQKQVTVFDDWVTRLKQAHGDLFETFQKTAKHAIFTSLSDGDKVFYRNMFISIGNVHSDWWLSGRKKEQLPGHPHPKYQEQKIVELVDRSKLRIETDEELFFLLRIMFGMLLQIFRTKLLDEHVDEKEDRLMERVNLLVNWLQHGILKEEK